jgi:hypothetical protein
MHSSVVFIQYIKLQQFAHYAAALNIISLSPLCDYNKITHIIKRRAESVISYICLNFEGTR